MDDALRTTSHEPPEAAQLQRLYDAVGWSTYTRDMVTLMRGLRGLNIIGVDINTMTPAHDPSGATAILGAGLLAEALGVLAESRN